MAEGTRRPNGLGRRRPRWLRCAAPPSGGLEATIPPSHRVSGNDRVGKPGGRGACTRGSADVRVPVRLGASTGADESEESSLPETTPAFGPWSAAGSGWQKADGGWLTAGGRRQAAEGRRRMADAGAEWHRHVESNDRKARIGVQPADAPDVEDTRVEGGGGGAWPLRGGSLVQSHAGGDAIRLVETGAPSEHSRAGRRGQGHEQVRRDPFRVRRSGLQRLRGQGLLALRSASRRSSPRPAQVRGGPARCAELAPAPQPS